MARVAEAVKENECCSVRGGRLHDDRVESTAWASLGGYQRGKCEAKKVKWGSAVVA